MSDASKSEKSRKGGSGKAKKSQVVFTAPTYAESFFTRPSQRRDLAIVTEGGRRVFINAGRLCEASVVFTARLAAADAAFGRPVAALPITDKKLSTLIDFVAAACRWAGAPTRIDESNVASLLSMADEFEVAPVRKRCELFVRARVPVATSAAERMLLLSLSTRHRLRDADGQPLAAALVPPLAQLSFEALRRARHRLDAVALAAIYAAKAERYAVICCDVVNGRGYECVTCGATIAVGRCDRNDSCGCFGAALQLVGIVGGKAKR